MTAWAIVGSLLQQLRDRCAGGKSVELVVPLGKRFEERVALLLPSERTDAMLDAVYRELVEATHPRSDEEHARRRNQ